MTNIEYLDLKIDWQDEGPWRSYHLTTQGDSLADCVSNAMVSEVGQDGDELDCYGLEEADFRVYQAALQAIRAETKDGSPLFRVATRADIEALEDLGLAEPEGKVLTFRPKAAKVIGLIFEGE